MAARSCSLFLAAVMAFPSGAWNQMQSSSATAPSANVAQPGETSSSSPKTTPVQQQSQPIYESAAVLRAITRLVVVDVVADDKKGEPVTDLKLPDFTIVEDGKPQVIKVFNFQQPVLQAASAAPATVPARLPENIYSNIPRYKPTSALNIVLLDALNTTLPNQAYVRDQMIHYLERMPEGRPVAVYTLGTRLRLLQDFTTDPAALKEVVRKLKTSLSPVLPNPTGGPEQEILPAGIADSGMMPAGMLDSIMAFEQEVTAEQADIRVAYTLNAMNMISRQLAGYPGRKNLVWVSEAFPITIGPDLELNNPFAGTRNYADQIAAAAQAMIDSQIAIYPVDAQGLVVSSHFSAQSSGRDKFGRSIGERPGRLASALSRESASLQDVHGTMEELAQRTGGKAFYNRNDIDNGIRRSIEDGSTYYTLAYYPENKNWNGKFRKIHVTVGRPGVKLHYRLGYYAIDPKVFTSHNEKQQLAVFSDALSLENPVATALTFHAGVISPSAATENKVWVNFGVDPQAISFEQDGAGLHHARIECAIAAFTTKGIHVKSTASTVNAALKANTFEKVMGGFFPCQESIDLPTGTYILRLGVRDLNTGLIGTTNAKVTVPPSEAASKPAQKEP